MAARTSWKQRIGEILALGAFAFVWVRIVDWLTWPLWGWLQAAVAVGGIATAGIAYESGKRFGRRSPEQPETKSDEAPDTASKRFAWNERTGFAWWALALAFFTATAFAEPLWLDLALCAALTPVVIWWERRWHRARSDESANALSPAGHGRVAATIVLMDHIGEWLPTELLLVPVLFFAGLMIWLFAYLCGLRLGRLEASAGSRRSDSRHSHIV